MPSWKGWNKEEVLQSRTNPDGSHPDLQVAHSTDPCVAGFTAINAPNAPGYISPSGTQQPNSVDAAQQAANGSGFIQSDQAITPISEYLGRSDPDGVEAPVLQGTGTLHGQGSKKATGSGKKRAGTSMRSQPASKKRKNSIISDGMPIAKSSATRPAATKKPTKLKASDMVLGSLDDDNDQDSKKETTRQASRDHQECPSLGDFSSAPTRSVPVFTSSTSMTSAPHSAQQTSVDALKASGAPGTTLYRGPQGSNEGQDDVCFTKPWLNQQLLTSVIDNVAANSRRLRPRKADMAHKVDQSVVESKEDKSGQMSKNVEHLRPVVEKKPRSNAKNRKAQARKTVNDTLNRQLVSNREQASEDEDFLSDDEERMAEVAEMADKIEKENLQKRSMDPMTSHPTQLPTPILSDCPPDPQPLPSTRKSIGREPTPILNPDEEFLTLCEDDETEPVDLTETSEDAIEQRQPTPPTRERKLNMRDVDEFEDYGGAFLSEAEKQLLESFKSTTKPDNSPIVRKPFSAPVLDRSPIFGAANTTLLRTCFRLGEAVNVGTQAVRSNQDMILELYARVTSSHREPKPGRKQHFFFKDLYHDKPPHLEGSFELWQQSSLWDLDSRAFLSPREGGIKCRAIAKMKREGMKWRLEILSIWEASWEDIEYVAGIYAREADFSDD